MALISCLCGCVCVICDFFYLWISYYWMRIPCVCVLVSYTICVVSYCCFFSINRNAYVSKPYRASQMIPKTKTAEKLSYTAHKQFDCQPSRIVYRTRFFSLTLLVIKSKCFRWSSLFSRCFFFRSPFECISIFSRWFDPGVGILLYSIVHSFFPWCE